MEKLDVKKYNISLITVGPPVKISNGYNLKILYAKKEFFLQSPLCEVEEIDIKSKKKFIKVSFLLSKNFSYFQFFCGLNQQIVEALEKYQETHEDISEELDSSSKREKDSIMTLFIKVNLETKFFDKERNEISGLEVQKGDKVVVLLENKGVFVDKDNATFRWTATQVLKFK